MKNNVSLKNGDYVRKVIDGIYFTVTFLTTGQNNTIESWFTLDEYPEFTFCILNPRFIPAESEKQTNAKLSFHLKFETEKQEQESKSLSGLDDSINSFIIACMHNNNKRIDGILSN